VKVFFELSMTKSLIFVPISSFIFCKNQNRRPEHWAKFAEWPEDPNDDPVEAAADETPTTTEDRGAKAVTEDGTQTDFQRSRRPSEELLSNYMKAVRQAGSSALDKMAADNAHAAGTGGAQGGTASATVPHVVYGDVAIDYGRNC
jgi:hypothetical protein